MKNIIKVAILLSVLFAGIQPASACWFEDPDPNDDEIISDTIDVQDKDGCRIVTQNRTTEQVLTESLGSGVTRITKITSRWSKVLSNNCDGQVSIGDWILIEKTTTVTTSYPPVETTDSETGIITTVTDSGSDIIDETGTTTGSETTTETVNTDPTTGTTTTTTETVTKDAGGTTTGSTTETSTVSTDPVTGDTTTTTTTVIKDETGATTGTVTETETVSTDPATGDTTTTTETVTKDETGATTETVTETEVKDDQGNVIEKETETVTTPEPEDENLTVTVTRTVTETSSTNAAQVKTTVWTIVTVTATTNNVTGITTTETDTVTTFWRICLICGKEGVWELPVCPDADLACPDCGENIHGVTDHICPGVPEDPTQADPGIDPPETGDPDPTPLPDIARFYFTRLNQLAITKPVGTTYTVDLPMSVYTASTTGSAPGEITIYLHCVPDEVTSGATYIPAVTSATLKSFTPPAPPLQLFGRSLFPNLTSSKGTDTWDSDDEFLLIISTDPDTADALTEVENCCEGAGCRYHLRVKFSETEKPGR